MTTTDTTTTEGPRCQHCDGLVAWASRTDAGFPTFVHLATNTTGCPL